MARISRLLSLLNFALAVATAPLSASTTPPTFFLAAEHPTSAASAITNANANTGHCTLRLTVFQFCETFGPVELHLYRTSTHGKLHEVVLGNGTHLSSGAYFDLTDARGMDFRWPGSGSEKLSVHVERGGSPFVFSYAARHWHDNVDRRGACAYCNRYGWSKGELQCETGPANGGRREQNMDCFFTC